MPPIPVPPAVGLIPVEPIGRDLLRDRSRCEPEALDRDGLARRSGEFKADALDGHLTVLRRCLHLCAARQIKAPGAAARLTDGHIGVVRPVLQPQHQLRLQLGGDVVIQRVLYVQVDLHPAAALRPVGVHLRHPIKAGLQRPHILRERDEEPSLIVLRVPPIPVPPAVGLIPVEPVGRDLLRGRFRCEPEVLDRDGLPIGTGKIKIQPLDRHLTVLCQCLHVRIVFQVEGAGTGPYRANGYIPAAIAVFQHQRQLGRSP